MKRRLLPAFLCAALGSATAALGQDAGFSEERLRAGIEAFQSGQTIQAVDEFRIAAFGFLDRPPLLAESLVRLALAQESLGRRENVARTLERFAQAERLLGGFAQARLEEPTRRAFRELAARRLSPEILASFPVLAAPGPSASKSTATQTSPAVGRPAGEAPKGTEATPSATTPGRQR